jgi:hypothetical protein
VADGEGWKGPMSPMCRIAVLCPEYLSLYSMALGRSNRDIYCKQRTYVQ